MRLSEDKVRHMSHMVYDGLSRSGAADFGPDDAKVRREIRLAMTRWLKTEDEVEDAVRKIIRSYSRNIVEGSPEYDVMFQKHYKEELARRGKG